MMNKKAISIVEYTLLFVIVLSAFLVMKNSIQRGFYGSWAQSGQSFAFGRQYDSGKSIDCEFDDKSNTWFDRNCIAALAIRQCADGFIDSTCVEDLIKSTTSCQQSSCEPLNNGMPP